MNNNLTTALITGASNGIGLDLTKKLLAEGIKVIAVTRSGEVAGFSHTGLTLIQGDISNEESIGKVATQVSELGLSIDCLINNAGVLVDGDAEVPTAAGLNASFATNTIGTALFTEALLNNLTDGGQIIFLSTIMALLRAAGPDAPGYRMSKAALNMYVVMLSKRLKKSNIRVTALHPGWVQTRMGGKTAPTTIEQSVNGIYKAIIENTQTGKFWNVDSAGIENF